MSFEAGERIAPPSRAYQAAMRVCGELGLVPSFRGFGTHLQSWNCDLHKQAQLQTNGRGKGLGQQSKTSALCEAIEHYLYEADDRSFDQYLQLDLSGGDARLAEGSPDFRLLLGDREATFSRITFTRMNGDDQKLYLPAFLQSPTYKSRREEENDLISRLGLLRYGTNNGTASGLTSHEAALHALLEIIERDAIGIEMLRVIVSMEPVPVRNVRLDTLPDALASLCRKAEEEATGSVRVWDITTDIGIPVFLAALDAPNRSYFGSGAALSSAYALERALLEAVQSFHVYEHMGSPPPLRGRTNFVETSHYQRCFLEAGHFSFRGGSSEVDFEEVPNESLSTQADMERTVAWVVRALSRRGIATFWRTLFEGEFSVVQVVAPQLERFHLVTQGVPVAPGARGRSFMLGS